MVREEQAQLLAEAAATPAAVALWSRWARTNYYLGGGADQPRYPVIKGQEEGRCDVLARGRGLSPQALWVELTLQSQGSAKFCEYASIGAAAQLHAAAATCMRQLLVSLGELGWKRTCGSAGYCSLVDNCFSEGSVDSDSPCPDDDDDDDDDACRCADAPFANKLNDVMDFHLSTDWCLPGLGDAGAHLGTIIDAGWPTWVLNHWCKERGFWSLAEAVLGPSPPIPPTCGFACATSVLIMKLSREKVRGAMTQRPCHACRSDA
jgi:hypothetical protein